MSQSTISTRHIKGDLQCSGSWPIMTRHRPSTDDLQRFVGWRPRCGGGVFSKDEKSFAYDAGKRRHRGIILETGEQSGKGMILD